MPYKGRDLHVINNFRALSTLPYDTGFTRQEHKAALMECYELPNIPLAQLGKIIQQIFPNFSLTQLDRSPEAMARREALSRDMQSIMLDTYLDSREFQASGKTDTPMPGLGLKAPWAVFVRQSTRAEDLSFNRGLEDCLRENDPVKTATYLFDEIQRCGRELGIRSVEDLYALRELSNEELIPKFPQMHRYAVMMDYVAVYMEKNTLNFTPQQQQQLTPLAFAASNMANACLSRMEMIANPYFKELGDTFFLTNKMGSLAFYANTVCADQKLSFKMVEYFGRASGYARHSSVLGEGPFQQKYPELRDAFFSATGGTARSVIEKQDPLVAVTRDSQVRVVIPGHPDKLLNNTDYLAQLAREAKDSDRWLLTGSRDFSKMQQALNRITDYCKKNPQPDPQKLSEMSEALFLASSNYLKHKKIGDPADPDRVSLRGKNAREQRRLDVARAALVFSSGLHQALENANEMEIAFEELSSEELLEDPEMLGIKAPRGFSEEEAENRFGKNDQKEIDARIQAEEERDGLVSEPKKPADQQALWELALQANTDTAQSRLEQYSQGMIKPDDMVGSKATIPYSEQLKTDIANVAFREALIMENHAMKGSGVLQTMLREQGYDTAFRHFSSMIRDAKAYTAAGLKGTEPGHIAQFLADNGPRKLARDLLQPEAPIQEQHSSHRELAPIPEEVKSAGTFSSM